MAITINTGGITGKQKSTAKFQMTHQGMLAQLVSPGFIPVLCAHEAAHLVYFALAGVKEYKAFPPRIVYDPKSDDFIGYLAGVQMLDIPKFVEGQFWEQFFKIACAHAAGGVISRKLMSHGDCGDEDDKERFELLCTEFTKRDPNFSIDVQDFWHKAQTNVSKALENREWLAKIQELAEQLRPELGL